MHFSKIIACSLAVTITISMSSHAMNTMHGKSLQDYQTFKQIHVMASDIKKILKAYDKEHDMSVYGISHHLHHTTSGLFLASEQYGLYASYTLHTPWGALYLARIKGIFERDTDTGKLWTKFSGKELECIETIKEYFFKNCSIKQTTDNLFSISTFKYVNLPRARKPKKTARLDKALIESAWRQLEKQQYNELQEQTLKEQEDNPGFYY